MLQQESALKLINKIEKGILALENNPYSFVEIKVKPHKKLYRKLVIDNFIVLYTVDEDNKKVIIYNVIYGKSDYLF